ncbi:hypothetical protein [Schaalia vaccimaxillae]|uniref:hypothetical protein n=1 Tax=Schaalia vaccimaxillae TaxID=183916 RepID=UPI0003B760D8|nr:hypothetical protein [Schaalia vaccimaxillae]
MTGQELNDAWFTELTSALRANPRWELDHINTQIKLTRAEFDHARATQALGSDDLTAEEFFGPAAAYVESIATTPPPLTDPIVSKRWYYLITGVLLAVGAVFLRFQSSTSGWTALLTFFSVVAVAMFFWGSVRLRSRRHR